MQLGEASRWEAPLRGRTMRGAVRAVRHAAGLSDRPERLTMRNPTYSISDRFSMRTAGSWKFVFVTVIFTSLLSVVIDACAQTLCQPKSVDVCEIARRISDETASTLPMQLNSNLSIQTVFAEQNTVSLVARLNYTHAHLDQTLVAAGVSNDKMLKVLIKTAKNGVCTRSSKTEYFVERGGQVRYIYQFQDGTTYTSILVSSCTEAATSN